MDLIQLDDDSPLAAPPEPVAESEAPECEEEEVDDRTAQDFLLDMNQIDEEMIDIRFKRNLEPTAILEELSKLMERRNTLSSRLQNARQAEFKAFVESLALGKIHIVPFLPTSRKCKLRVNDDEAAELLNKPPVLKKPTFGIGKKPELHGLAGENFQRCEKRAAEISRDLSVLGKKKLLSPSDTAQKLRLEAEMDGLSRFLPPKK